MIKDMHVAVGSLHRRIDGLEAAAAEQVGGGWGGGGAADGSGPASGRASVSGEPSSLKEVQVGKHTHTHSTHGLPASALQACCRVCTRSSCARPPCYPRHSHRAASVLLWCMLREVWCVCVGVPTPRPLLFPYGIG